MENNEQLHRALDEAQKEAQELRAKAHKAQEELTKVVQDNARLYLENKALKAEIELLKKGEAA